MGNPVVHFEVGVTDGARSREFYGRLFDWSFQTEPGQPNTLVVFEEGIGGNLMEVPDGVGPYVSFYVQVDNLESYLEEAGHLGGKTVVPPMPLPDVGSFAMLSDPDGNVIGLFVPAAGPAEERT